MKDLSFINALNLCFLYYNNERFPNHVYDISDNLDSYTCVLTEKKKRKRKIEGNWEARDVHRTRAERLWHDPDKLVRVSDTIGLTDRMLYACREAHANRPRQRGKSQCDHNARREKKRMRPEFVQSLCLLSVFVKKTARRSLESHKRAFKVALCSDHVAREKRGEAKGLEHGQFVPTLCLLSVL